MKGLHGSSIRDGFVTHPPLHHFRETTMEPETTEALDIIWDTIEKHDEELNNLLDQITEEYNEQVNNIRGIE
jgi:hypothetical protein